jgi:hypothetical protein
LKIRRFNSTITTSMQRQFSLDDVFPGEMIPLFTLAIGVEEVNILHSDSHVISSCFKTYEGVQTEYVTVKTK